MNESKIDTFSRLIARKIVRLTLDRVQKLNAKKKLVIGIKNLDPSNDEFTVKLTVILRQGNKRVNVAGSWIPALDVLEIDVFFETIHGLFDSSLVSQFHSHLYDTVRHEIEHSMQEKPANLFSDDNDDSSADILWRDLQKVEQYFTSNNEVSAFVAGLYHKAKRGRQPLVKIINDKLEAYKEVALHYNPGNANVIERLFERIRATWLDYARKRFPKAQTWQ